MMDAQFLIEVEALAAALDQLDYFGILKLPQTAAPADIKAAYYRESRAYHPDRFARYQSAKLRQIAKWMSWTRSRRMSGSAS